MRLLFLSFVLILSCHVNAQQDNQSFKKLNALRGTWSMKTKNGQLIEKWHLVDDSTFYGIGMKVSENNDTTVLENVQLLMRGNSISYIPIVDAQNNRQPVVFKLKEIVHNEYIFENPGHDYPQRVIYRIPVNDSLHARIEGMKKGHLVKSEFRYKKVN